MTEGQAILLVAHGSAVPVANEDVARVADAIRARTSFSCVEISYLERTTPSIPEGIDACVRRGAQRILIVPYFLSLGAHVRRDLPREARLGEERHAGVEIRIGEPLGFDPRLVELALDRVAEGLRAHGWSGPPTRI